MRHRLKPRHAFALALVFALPGCAGNSLGALGDILGGVGGMPGSGGQEGQISAEIRRVNTQQQTIQVATQDGQSGDVHYDQNTVVVYQQEQYPVTALEPGDLVVLQVQETAQGSLYTNRIDVQTSVQDRGGQSGAGNVQQYSGRVGQIDHERGLFVLQMPNGNVTVSVPYNAPQATIDYFHRLRVGNDVRLQATTIDGSHVQIYRFL
ncbi:MAG TPA: hypothetical protein VHG09_14455 [Longimicrobiales bacterium]|nr:hypothetical protein [Longimicrobiales bacterium]